MPFDHAGHRFAPTAVSPSDLSAPLPSGYSYQSLVAPPTTLTPGELLDRHYNGRSQGTGNAGGRPERLHGPMAVPVPFDPAFNGSYVILEFKTRDQGCPSKGIHFGDLLATGGNTTKLEGAQDIVLDRLSGFFLNFVVSWPGYPTLPYPIQVISSTGGRMTRYDLAVRIMNAYSLLFSHVENVRLMSSKSTCYTIALQQGLSRRPDTLGIQFTQLHLVRVRGTIGGTWMADIEVVA